MIDNKYHGSNKLFIICMISLVVSLSLLLFAFYIFSHLLLGWVYDAPEFIYNWRQVLIEDYGFGQTAANLIIFLGFLILSLLVGLISYATSKRIETEEGIRQLPEDPEEKHELRDTFSFSGKLLLVIVAVIIAVVVIQKILSVPII